MRHLHSSITPAVVHQEARHALQRVLEWKPYHESVTVMELLSLLLLMASRRQSLFATVKRLFDFSHETASRAIKAQLPSLEQMTNGLLDALHDVPKFTARQRRQAWTIAIDIHNVCYYGKWNPYLVGGQKKQGTQWFYSYATAILLHKRARYTVGLTVVLPGDKPHQIVRTLLDQIARKGLKIRGVALDSGFDSGDTILLLQERHLGYVVPMRRKGKGTNARNQCFKGRHKQIRWLEWKTKQTHLSVRTRTLLWKKGPKTMLFAFDGSSHDRARSLYQTAFKQPLQYRRRFGIETSYRQKNQTKAPTTSDDPVYRLLLEGVAYILRQVWEYLTREIARRRHLPPGAWVAEFTVQIMIDWLVAHLAKDYPENNTIPLLS